MYLKVLNHMLQQLLPPFAGGVEDPSQLPLPQHRSSLVGCVSDLSVGDAYNVDLAAEADGGSNVEDCETAF